MSALGISTKNNPEQTELLRLIMDTQHPIIVCNGNAGTGKNFVSLAAALELRSDRKYNRIYYTRNASEVGRSLGFLKGGMEQKFGPYTAPVSDTVESIIRHSTEKLNYNDLMMKIECLPLAYIRGRNIESSILICDECQNLSLTELQTIITRMGKFSKIILLGSFSQVDEHSQLRKDKCDFELAAEAMSKLPYVGYVELKQSMRSPWCAEIDALFDSLKNEQEKQTEKE